MPQEMNAIDPAGPGGPDVLILVRRPVPQPGAGELLIQVAAAGVNRPDVVQRLGAYPPPPGAPSIPGLEVAGIVAAVGAEVPEALVGQPVCALVAGGGYAEYCVAPVGQCMPVPGGLTMIEAAAMPETLFTVWSNLFECTFQKPFEALNLGDGIGKISDTSNRFEDKNEFRIFSRGYLLKPHPFRFKRIL